ncbi:hypothetical protein JN12_00877 [Geobacter argillaceus]|uniref:Uncharacterized protein n=2 Tax=Geobacter argillaceus TaxID=345631 RepID=A0A562WRJ2_9BACT|nr:hypothetical protein JN12_00877 [Geobacter argillaceus]
MQMMFSLIVFGFIFLTGAVPAVADDGNRPAEKRISYDPAIMYPGPYTPEHLFYKNPKGPVWLQWTAGDFTRKVTCSGALKRLKRKGVWQGHLKPDGSCGSPAEPSDWAVGNWINYYLSSSPGNRQ